MSDKQVKESVKEDKTRVAQRNAPVEATQEQMQTPPLASLVGNHAMTGLLTGRPTQSGLASFIQTKMKLDTPGDAYEQEADQMASRTVATIQQQSSGSPVARQNADEDGVQRVSLLQREGAEEEELQGKLIEGAPRPGLVQREGDPEEEETVQMKAIAQRVADPLAGAEVGGEVEQQINTQRGGGAPLAEGTRSQFEPAMGYDLGNVRVHTDPTADNLSRSIGAKAFTTGSDVFFSSGTYDPSSTDGQLLLGHELTHVVQQGHAAPLKKEGE